MSPLFKRTIMKVFKALFVFFFTLFCTGLFGQRFTTDTIQTKTAVFVYGDLQGYEITNKENLAYEFVVTQVTNAATLSIHDGVVTQTLITTDYEFRPNWITLRFENTKWVIRNKPFVLITCAFVASDETIEYISRH